MSTILRTWLRTPDSTRRGQLVQLYSLGGRRADPAVCCLADITVPYSVVLVGEWGGSGMGPRVSKTAAPARCHGQCCQRTD